jgi:hypothetical protein
VFKIIIASLEAPGVGQCGDGIGPILWGAFGSLIKWAEDGIAPDTLIGTSQRINSAVLRRPLCPYPLVGAYKGGRPKRGLLV